MDPILKLLIEGSLGGLAGALAILAASYFLPTGLSLKDLTWQHKALFLLAGTVVATAINYERNIGVEWCMAIGTGWPYIAVGFQSTFSSVGKARKRLKSVGKAATMKAIESVLENIKKEDQSPQDENGEDQND